MKIGCLVREREGKVCGGGVRLTSEIRGDGNIYLASGRHNGCLVLCGVSIVLSILSTCTCVAGACIEGSLKEIVKKYTYAGKQYI